MNSTLKFAFAAVLLAATAAFLQARNHNEVLPPRLPLTAFPQQLDAWSGTEIPIPQEQLDVLGAGDFMLRVYRDTSPQQSPYVDLFVAYFPSQRAGDTIHSPKNCLPGAGWSPVESSRISVSLPGRSEFPANRYVIAKGSDRQLVLYWYWAHDRAVASEYWAKFYLVADSMRLNRSDGALVRVTTPLSPNEPMEVAEKRLLGFSAQVVPLLNQYIPR